VLPKYKMPNKNCDFFHVSFHPAEGVNSLEQQKILQAVGKRKDIVLWILVAEPNNDESGTFHCHLAYTLNKQSLAQTQSDRWQTVFKDRFGDARWGLYNSIVVTTPPDFYMIAAGYLGKDDEKQILGQSELDQDKLKKANIEYAEKLRIQSIRRLPRTALPRKFREYHDKNVIDNPDCAVDYKEMEIVQYQKANATQQVEFIAQQLIADGYHHLVTDIYKMSFLAPIIRGWYEITTGKTNVSKQVEFFKNNFPGLSITNGLLQEHQGPRSEAGPPSSSCNAPQAINEINEAGSD